MFLFERRRKFYTINEISVVSFDFYEQYCILRFEMMEKILVKLIWEAWILVKQLRMNSRKVECLYFVGNFQFTVESRGVEGC